VKKLLLPAGGEPETTAEISKDDLKIFLDQPFDQGATWTSIYTPAQHCPL